MKKSKKERKEQKTGGVPVGGVGTGSISFSIGFSSVELPPLDELPILGNFDLSVSEFALWEHLVRKHDLLLLENELQEVINFCKVVTSEKATTQTVAQTPPPPQSDESEKEGVTTVTEHYERFDEYGTVWENEVMKLPKAVLLSMLSDATKTRCAEMLDGNESKIYLMRVLKRQIIDAQSTKDKEEKGVFD